MDILKSFFLASKQRKFLLLAIDYFTKWIEAEPLAKIIKTRMKNIWKSIVCRFDLPRTIITNNNRQFNGFKQVEFCRDLEITHCFTSIGHLQANGEAKVANRTLLQRSKIWLNRAKRLWVNELYHILWTYQTTQRVSTGKTPFNLAFKIESLIPLEMGLLSLRVENLDESSSSEQLRTNLDLLEEVRERVAMTMHLTLPARYHNARVRGKVFKTGDLVLRWVEVSQPTSQEKLSPNWEGLYRVEIIRPGTYCLMQLDGTPLSRSWNSENLRVHYQ